MCGKYTPKTAYIPPVRMPERPAVNKMHKPKYCTNPTNELGSCGEQTVILLMAVKMDGNFS